MSPTDPFDTNPPAPTDEPGGMPLAVGVVMLTFGTIGVPACLVAALLTANPCGTFGDACDEHGQTSSAAVVFLYGSLLAGIVAVAGLALTIVGFTSRSRRRGGTLPGQR